MGDFDITSEHTSGTTSRDVVSEALSAAKRADELRGEAIKTLLKRREDINANLRVLGYNEKNGTPQASIANTEPHLSPIPEPRNSKRFRDMKLADVGRTLIRENCGPLHGSEIEKRAKAGGFPGGTENFQNYMPVAFKRDGGFVNIGRNTWDLVKST
jgi:hypothetical protein